MKSDVSSIRLQGHSKIMYLVENGKEEASLGRLKIAAESHLYHPPHPTLVAKVAYIESINPFLVFTKFHKHLQVGKTRVLFCSNGKVSFSKAIQQKILKVRG